MRINNLKNCLLWLGIGLIITAFLYVYQESYNSKYKFVNRSIKNHKVFKSLSEKRSTYYEFSGAVTVGGALIILGLGLKSRK